MNALFNSLGYLAVKLVTTWSDLISVEGLFSYLVKSKLPNENLKYILIVLPNHLVFSILTPLAQDVSKLLSFC